MHVVIEISSYDKEWITNGYHIPEEINTKISEAIAKGISLPKGHGDLKDLDNLQYIFDLTREDPIYSGKDIERAIKSMKSIIEADKGGDK